MSLLDCLIDTGELFCESCGVEFRAYGRLCWDCRADLIELHGETEPDAEVLR